MTQEYKMKTTTPAKKATQLKRLIQSEEMGFLMEAHSGLSARIAEEAGFAGIWASGLSISASLGVRDNNEPNLIHILLDNEMHESTGGQSTVSHSVDFAAIARGCGYPRVIRAGSLDQLAEALGQPTERLTFIHVKTRPGEVGILPRPALTFAELAERFRKWLRQDG